MPPGHKYRALAAAFSLGFLTTPALGADPQGYTITFTGIESSAIRDTLRASSQLVTLSDAGPIPPFALTMRARGDIPRLQTALDSFGYYQNSIVLTIAGLAPDDPELPATLDDIPQGQQAPVVIAVSMGPLYRLGRIALQGDAIAERHRGALGINSGEPVLAGRVLDARARLQVALQEDGYALAKVDAPDAVADDTAHTIDVTYPVTAGRQVNVGQISFNGLGQVNESFVRRALTVHSGERYRPSRIEEARRTMAGLGVFSGVSVHVADKLSEDGDIPLTFDVQERKRHAVTLSGNYSTDLGISLSTTWSHRNLFGNAEQLNLTAGGAGLGNASAGLSYNLSAQYVQPLFLRQDQLLEVTASGVKQQLEAYDQTAQTLAAFVRRKFSPLWSGSAGLSVTHDLVAQQGVSRLYNLVAAPVTVSYNSTGIEDVLRDPVTGLRAALSLSPTHAFGGGGVSFLVAQASAATYFDVTGDGRSVVALRALAASILGSSNLGLPPDQRLYAGGSATVRGYAYQSLGPQFPDGSPVGAKSVDAATVELRQRIGEDWGAAAFVDAGQAGTGAPFTGKVYAGAGAGVRYYTSIGAVRVDVATPLVHLPGAASFQLYIGLGQAF